MKLPTSPTFRKSMLCGLFRSAIESNVIQVALAVLRHEIGIPREAGQKIQPGEPGFTEWQAHRRSWELGYNAAFDHFISMGHEPPVEKQQAEKFAAQEQMALAQLRADCPPELRPWLEEKLKEGRPADA